MHTAPNPFFSYNRGVLFRLREYEPADFETLWRLDQTCFAPGVAYSRRELMTYIARKGSFTLVAEERGTEDRTPPREQAICGFITADKGRARIGHIITIDVLPRVRRHGVGSMLLGAAEGRLHESGCSAVSLETAVDNTGAFAFYKRHGFFLVRTVSHYYSTGVDAFVLKKDLRLRAASE